MGASVFSEVDTNKYFSISTITREKMAKNGLKMTVSQLKELARKAVPVAEILTGQSREAGYRRKTKIYKYEDFKNIKIGGDSM